VGLLGRRSSGSVFGTLLDELRDEQRRRAAPLYPPRPRSPASDAAQEEVGSGAPPAASPLSPFGSLLGELREHRRRRYAAIRKAPALAVRPARPGGPEPDVRLETRLVTRQVWASGPASLLPVSLLLHAALLVAAIVVPLSTTQGLPVPASTARAFLVEPSVAQAPAPPPPPAPRTAAPAPTRSKPAARTFTAPRQTPDGIAPDLPIDLGAPGEVAGGVEGGVPGGVVGGIVGGLPPAPRPTVPVRVGGEIKEPAKIKHVPPAYPDIAVRANVSGTVVLECLVSPQGRVTEVKVLRGIPLLDAAAVAAVRQWVYTPTLRDGVPVPLMMTVTVAFTLESGGPR